MVSGRLDGTSGRGIGTDVDTVTGGGASGRARSWREGATAVPAGIAAYAAFRLLVEVVRLPAEAPPAVVLPAFALSAAGSIGVPVWLLAALARESRLSRTLLWSAAGAALWSMAASLPYPATVVAGDLGKVLLAGGIGLMLGRALREPNLLLPAGLFAAFADAVVVSRGTVRIALSTPAGAELVKKVSAGVPAIHPSLPSLTIGPADFLFLGFFLCCAARFGWGLRRNAGVLALVLALSLGLVPLLDRVPALAPMGLAFLLLNARRFRLTRTEMIGSVLVLLLAGGLFWGYFELLGGRQ